MTRKKQYKKRLPAVLPPAPRTEPASGTEPEPQTAGPQAPGAPVLPTPRAPEPAATPKQTTADFVREMKERAGVVSTPAVEEVDDEEVDDEPEVDDAEVDDEPEVAVAPAAPAEPQPELAREPEPEPQPEPQPVPQPVPQPHDRRPGRALLLAGVLLIGIAAGALAYWWGTGDDEPAPEAAWTAPTGLAPDEGYVETRVHADGTMEVRQWIRADEPLERLTLRVPRVSSAGQLAADRVEVLADGTRVSGREEISYFHASYDLGGATEVELRYRLVGALQRSDSAPGRALAVATALDARFSPAPAREVRVVKAPEVLSLACTPAADVTPVPCGTPEGDGEWQVDLPGRRVAERVVASLTVG